jgi:predicted nucleic acid-binding protein
VTSAAALVLDSSAFVALLTDSGPEGQWVAGRLKGAALAAPALALYEAGNVLRRLELSGGLDPSEAALAHDDLLAMPVEWWPYEPLGPRVWQLRRSVTVYDAAYVALAELLELELLTLDERLAASNGPHCRISTPNRTGSTPDRAQVSW